MEQNTRSRYLQSQGDALEQQRISCGHEGERYRGRAHCQAWGKQELGEQKQSYNYGRGGADCDNLNLDDPQKEVTSSPA